MALRPIMQENMTGCFVAAVATLLGKSYNETFRLLHPGKDPVIEWEHGFKDTSMTRAALRGLARVGVKGHVSKFKKFSDFQRHDQHALLIVRWNDDPCNMCHTLVFDGEQHQFLDPGFGTVVGTWDYNYFEKQLDSAIVIDSLPEPKKTHANRTRTLRHKRQASP